MALVLEDRPLRISPRSSLGEQDLAAPCLRSEGLRTWIFLLEMRHWLQRVDLVYKRAWAGVSVELTALGYGIHYPVRHGQVENWV